MKKRYPGPLPFAYDDRNLFFGREPEIEYLTTLITNNQITVLHGKSGYGKSSLINAGLIPALLENFNCEIIRVRFYNYDKTAPLNPLSTFLNTIRQHVSGAPYLDGFINVERPSAWAYFKKLQYEVLKKLPPDEEISVAAQLSYILIIDQFEELFTYPKEMVIELAEAFREILLHRIPEEYQERLKERIRDRENLEAYKEQLSVLDKDIPLKVIFSLRTERFNYLTHLVNYIPTLLNNTYKVKRMTARQVRMAITKPAAVADEAFNSPPFVYDKQVVDRLIDFLNADTKGENEGKIEVFEMQIICQKLEEILIQHLATHEKEYESNGVVLFKEDVILKSSAIKDRQNPYGEIIKNYYKETIESIPETVEQLSARYLIEFKLIDSVTNNRISLDNAFVKQTGISEPVLRHLIDKRMVRIEVNTVSGHSLEISHDSLVSPILNAAAELGSLDKKLAAFYEKAVADSDDSKALRTIINDVLLEERETKKKAAAELSDADFALLRASPVIIQKKPAEGKNDIQAFGVKKIFQQTAQQSRARAQQSSTKGWVKRFAVVSVIFIGVIVFLLILQSVIKHRANRLSALLFLSVADTMPNKEDALRLAYYIHQQQVLDKRDSLIFKKKLQDILNSQEIQALFSYLSVSIPSSNLKREEIDVSQGGEFSIYNYKSNEADLPWGQYYYCNEKGRVLKQFENILYTYFTNRKDIAILAKASVGSDSLYSNTNKLARAFVLLNCRTGKSETVTLESGHYLYPPDYGALYPANDPTNYRVHFNHAGNVVVPVYDPSVVTASQQVKLISSSILNDSALQTAMADTTKDEEITPLNTEAMARVKRFLQDGIHELVGVNLKKNILIYKSKNDQYSFETLQRRALETTGNNASFLYNQGFQSAVYNEQADATLVYTKDNRLYLLDSTFHIKAGFQLTANDLYGFAEDGTRFFYVRNNALSFFDNTGKLIDLFDYEQTMQWLQNRFQKSDKATLQSLRAKYDMQF